MDGRAEQIERVFLGWDAPILPAAAAWIAERARQGLLVDLSEWRIVVPGRRARRHLLAMLVDRAEAMGAALRPPTLQTVHEFVDACARDAAARRGRPVAGEVTRALAWRRAVRRVPAAALGALVPSKTPSDRLLDSLGDELARVCAELVGSGIDPGEVPALAGSLLPPGEAERWVAMGGVRAEARSILDSWGLAEPMDAAWDSINDSADGRTRRTVLAACAELSVVARALLGHCGGGLASLIAAPTSEADRFDAFGCVRVEAWERATVSLGPDAVRFARDDEDQAELALSAIAESDGPLYPDEVTLVTPEAEAASAVERLARRVGTIEVHAAAGRAMSMTGPARLVRAIAAIRRTGRVAEIRPLIHLRSARAWLWHGSGEAHEADLLERLDRFDRDRPGAALDEESCAAIVSAKGKVTRDHNAETDARADAAVRAALDRVRSLLSVEDRAASVGEAVRSLLAEVFEEVAFDAGDAADAWDRASCERLAGVLDEISRLERADPTERLSVDEVLGLLADATDRDAAPIHHGPEAVEMIGWLDAWLDPARVVIATGLIEGVVPGGSVADSFLPDALRAELGLVSDRARLAFDAYRLTALCRSHERVTLLCPRRGPEGDPRFPSRLLFLDPDADANAERARAFARVAGEEPVRVARDRALGARNAFDAAPVFEAPLPTMLPVTSFKVYLESPYLFHLRYVARVEPVDPPPREMDAASFGSLAHDALNRFALSDARGSSREQEIREALLDMLADEARKRLGLHPVAAVRVQEAFLHQRLEVLARAQARRRDEGWVIVHQEWKPTQPASIVVDGVPMGLSGRIDRIDRHEATGALAIFDYKTSESGHEPDKVHRRGPVKGPKRWVDLQLPLYRHVASELIGEAPVTLGYIALPSKPEACGFHPAPWDDALLREADEEAARVVRDIRARRFEMGDPKWARGSVAAIAGLGLAPDANDEEDDA
ncbi:MAG: PD-(D/E)XK nuclease family protein [Phycisphaerales bacterium JB037]